jgi:hypothetical protein
LLLYANTTRKKLVYKKIQPMAITQFPLFALCPLLIATATQAQNNKR